MTRLDHLVVLVRDLEGALSVELAADAPGGELDRRLSHGVVIRVAGG